MGGCPNYKHTIILKVCPLPEPNNSVPRACKIPFPELVEG